jgi:hypothetical protein
MFLRFSTHFTSCCKSHALLKLRIFTEAPGLSAGSQICPSFAVRTSERFLTLQCSPWGAVAGAARRIPASSPTPAAGKGWERGPRPPRARFRGSVGPGRRPTSGAPAADGGGRCGPCCGAVEARSGLARGAVAALGSQDEAHALLGRGRPGEELAGGVQEHDAARSTPPRQGTIHICARRPPDVHPRLPRRARGPRPRPACATGGADGPVGNTVRS